jgi:predicted nucleotidyltransferase
MEDMAAILTAVMEAHEMDDETRLLHQEIATHLAAALDKYLQRESAVKCFTIRRFGSFLSHTAQQGSDIDLAVEVRYHSRIYNPKGYDGGLLDRLRAHLWDRSPPLDLALGERPPSRRLTLWKTTHLSSGTAIDVSLNNGAGADNAVIMGRLVANTPMARPLIQLLKVLLRQHGLIEGKTQLFTSYSASVMALVYLKHFPAGDTNLFVNFYKLVSFVADPATYDGEISLRATDGTPHTDSTGSFGPANIICPGEGRDITPQLKVRLIVNVLQRTRAAILSKNNFLEGV